jgi:hypothetical protein
MDSPKSPPSQVVQSTQTVYNSSSTPTQTSNSQVTTTTTTNPVVAIPVPVVPPVEGAYVYIFIKGSLYADFTTVFGLDEHEKQAVSSRFNNSFTQIDNGIMFKASVVQLINALAQLGYKIVCSTGETDVTWTLQREA